MPVTSNVFLTNSPEPSRSQTNNFELLGPREFENVDRVNIAFG